MNKTWTFLMLMCLSVSCGGTVDREHEALTRLVNEYLTHPNWEVRRQKRRNLITQGKVVIPYLWEASDTDYFERLHHVLGLLNDLRAFDKAGWAERRKDLRQRALLDLAEADEASLFNRLNRLSLYGEVEDARLLGPALKHPARPIRELALATAYRLGLPFMGTSPRAVADRLKYWHAKEYVAGTRRENQLWKSLETADNDVYRQTLVQGLTHCIVARPLLSRRRAGDLWKRMQAEDNSHVRVEMVLLLGVLGDRRFQEPLLETRWLNSADKALQMATSWSLNQLGFKNPQPKN